jgi:hypothetical protein
MERENASAVNARTRSEGLAPCPRRCFAPTVFNYAFMSIGHCILVAVWLLFAVIRDKLKLGIRPSRIFHAYMADNR